MERKNIFQLIKENYNIDEELRKIDRLFKEKAYFFKDIGKSYGIRDFVEKHTLTFILETYIFDQWKHRGTCVNIEEFIKRAGAALPNPSSKINEAKAINYIEVMLNLIKLYKDNKSRLADVYIGNYSDFDNTFCHLVETAKMHLGLTERNINGTIIVYPKNAPLEQVLNVTIDGNAQWELIRYCREKMDLAEKKKSLGYFATAFCIEADKDDDQATKLIVEKAKNMLNNLDIRHNNQTGKHKKEYLKDITEPDAISLFDLLYNQILTIILLREQRKYDTVYKAFKEKQKAESHK